MAYSLKNVANQKPATITAVVISGLTLGHLTWGDGSPISSDHLLAVESFLLLLLGLFWVDAITVNAEAAKAEKDEAFLQGLALPSTRKTMAELDHLGPAAEVDPAPDAVEG